MSDDRPTLEALLERARPRLVDILRTYQIPPEAGADLLSDLVRILVVRRDRIERPVPWLLLTLRNLCVRYWRERLQKVRPRLVVGRVTSQDLDDRHLGAEEGFIDATARMFEAIGGSERVRKVVLMHLLGLTPLETAAELDLTWEQVRRALDEGFSALRKVEQSL